MFRLKPWWVITTNPLEWITSKILSQVLMWWLILCVNLTELRDAQIAGKHFWVSLWGCLQERLAFKSVDWVKKIFLYQHRWASSNLLMGPDWIKRQRRGKFSCSLLELRHPFYPALKHQSFWWSGFWSQAELYYRHSWCFSLLTAYCETSQPP